MPNPENFAKLLRLVYSFENANIILRIIKQPTPESKWHKWL